MTPLRIQLNLLLVPVVLALLTSCSPDEGTQNESTHVEQRAKPFPSQPALLELPRPNPTTMAADVAKVLETGWNELDLALTQQDLDSKAQAEAYANYGLIAFGNGLTPLAEVAFENATRLDPKDARWLYFLALMHEQTGMLGHAATKFERVLELLPGNLPVLLRFGGVRFEQARMQDAQELYRLALEADPESAAALYGLGRIASAEGNDQQAVKHFEKALELQPFADRINYFLGLAWRNLGKRDKAESFLAKHGTNEPSFYDPLFDEISGGKARIEGLWVHMNAGSQAFVDGNYSRAVDEFRLATRDLPNDPRSWQSLGMALNKTQDSEGAKAAYRQALDLSKNNAVIHHELAKLLMQSGAPEDAEQHLLEAIGIDPRMLAAHTTLAGLLARSGRMQEALSHYEAAIALDSQSGELAISRAETLVALDRIDDAARALAEMTKINPNDANVRMTFGLILADAGQFDKALAETSQALSFAGDDETRGRAHYAVGQVQIRRGDAHSAISSFGSALKLNPRHDAAGLELARSFIRVKNYNQALATYETHIGYWPDNDGTRVEAARVAIMLGNGAKAKSILEVAAVKKSASARLLGSLARLLVLSTEMDVRDPKLALELAERALAKNRGLQHRESVALCHAAAGDFDTAVKIQQRLLQETGAQSSARVRNRMETNLARYRAGDLGRLPFDAS